MYTCLIERYLNTFFIYFNNYKMLELWPVFLKVKKSTFYLINLYGFTKIKDEHFIIRCAIKFYINMITTVVVWWQYFLLKKWIKVRANFFFLILNFWFWCYFTDRPPVKMVDLFIALLIHWVFIGCRLFTHIYWCTLCYTIELKNHA
jgi:hypothetical protein